METRSFLAIASVERTGSTLLCSILRGTNLAGSPIEYLNIQTKNFARIRNECGQPKIKLTHQPLARVRKLTGRYPWRDISYFSSASWRQYLTAIASQSTTANGVFGVKMHWNQYKRHMLDMGVDASFWNVPVKWVRITREDELLLVAAGEFRRAQRRVARAHVVGLHHLRGLGAHRAAAHEAGLAVAILVAEHGRLPGPERQHQAAPMPVLGHMR